MSGVPVPLRRIAFRSAHLLMRTYWRIAHPHTRGVKCIVREGGDVLFVRHTYGDRRAWELPGGGLKRGEEPRTAVAREAREELGVEVAEWRELGTIVAHGYGKHTTISCFEGLVDGRAITIDEGELQEARWCDPADPPAPLGVDARTVLMELLLSAPPRPAAGSQPG